MFVKALAALGLYRQICAPPPPQVGYFHGFIDGVDFVFVDHPAFHYVADSIYGGDRQAITWRCALLCKVRGSLTMIVTVSTISPLARCGKPTYHSHCLIKQSI